MNKTVLFILLISCGIWTAGMAQITLNESTFPSVGDVITLYSTQQSTIDVKPGASGSTSWDFTGLSVGSQSTIQYTSPENKPFSSFFQDADMNVQQGNVSFYYAKNDEQVKELGIAGVDPVLSLIDTYTRYDGNRYTHRAGITYGDAFRNEFSMKFSEAKENLPDTFQNYLTTFGIDSLRFVSNIEENDNIDAYGSLKIGDKTYDVLRSRRLTIIDSEIFAYQGLFGWVPVDPELLPIEGAANFIGRDTIKSYIFLANNVKAPVANVTVDIETNIPQNVTFLDRTSSSSRDLEQQVKSISAFPNPTYGDITFTVKNYGSPSYTLEVYNIIGVKLLSRSFNSGSDTLKTNLNTLSKGTYLYSIFDAKGKKLTTKRLVIVTP